MKGFLGGSKKFTDFVGVFGIGVEYFSDWKGD
jgi:hypothetical protein